MTRPGARIDLQTGTCPYGRRRPHDVMSDTTLIEQTASRPFRIRPNEYDVTSRVCVSSADDVHDAVQNIFRQAFPNSPFDVL